MGLALADRTLAFARPLGRVDRRPDRPFAEFPAQVSRRLRALAAEHRVAGLVRVAMLFEPVDDMGVGECD